MRNRNLNARRLTVLALLIALNNVGTLAPSSVLAADTKNNGQIAGQLTVTGAVTINDKKALSGTTVFNNSRLSVACAGGNRAIVNLGRLGRLELNPGTQMMLRFADGLISGELVMGRVTVNAPAGVKVAINTPEGVSAADGKEPAVMAVATQRGVRCVPVMMSNSGSANPALALGGGALAALLLGAGGTAAAVAVAGTSSQASSIVP
jgi:hypothetical protein